MEATVIRDVSYHELDLNPPVGKYWSSPAMKKGDVYPVLVHYLAFVRVLYAPDTEVLVSKSAVSFDGGVTPAMYLEVGDKFVMRVGPLYRLCRVLAEIGDLVLVEQKNIATTSLRVLNRRTLEVVSRPKYNNLPAEWAEAMLTSGIEWEGRIPGGRIPSPGGR